jgi:hypothetical protein
VTAALPLVPPIEEPYHLVSTSPLKQPPYHHNLLLSKISPCFFFFFSGYSPHTHFCHFGCVRKTYLLSVFLSNSTPRKPPYLCIEGIGEEGYLFCIFFFLRPLSLFYTVERVEEEDGGAKHTQMFIIYTHTHTLHSRSGSFCICSCVYVLFAFGPVSTFVLGYIDNPKYCFGVDGSSIAGHIAFIL